MSKIHGWCRFLVLGALLAAVPAARAQEEGDVPPSLDDEFAQLAAKVPGFGGLYLDERGTTHVYLQDTTRAGEVQDLGARVEVDQGAYDFRDLSAWKEAVRPLLIQRGAVFLDIDEQRNRLLFGVERDSVDAFSDELEGFLRSTRVPREAVLVEAAEPMLPVEQLNDRIRPVPGAVQIQSVNGTCTLGVNGLRLGVKGFVTASHCTATRSAVDGTVFFQNTVASGNQIGVETADPGFFGFFQNMSCPPGFLCRRSDAAFVAYDSAALSAGPKIANPLSCSSQGGSLLVDPFFPRLVVSGVTFGSPVVGSIVTKSGSVSGCTCGPTKNTCTDIVVAGSVPTILMLCQNRVTAGVQAGDSGSPVYFDNLFDATLTGILWGRSQDATIFSYSPWLFVYGELGGVVPTAL